MGKKGRGSLFVESCWGGGGLSVVKNRIITGFRKYLTTY